MNRGENIYYMRVSLFKTDRRLIQSFNQITKNNYTGITADQQMQHTFLYK